MEKENKTETERVQKGNSSDTLLAIYVLRVLKKYSSVDNKITAKDVYKRLVDEHYINDTTISIAFVQGMKIPSYLLYCGLGIISIINVMFIY